MQTLKTVKCSSKWVCCANVNSNVIKNANKNENIWCWCQTFMSIIRHGIPSFRWYWIYFTQTQSQTLKSCQQPRQKINKLTQLNIYIWILHIIYVGKYQLKQIGTRLRNSCSMLIYLFGYTHIYMFVHIRVWVYGMYVYILKYFYYHLQQFARTYTRIPSC